MRLSPEPWHQAKPWQNEELRTSGTAEKAGRGGLGQDTVEAEVTMKLAAAVALVLSSAVLPVFVGPARAQQWPTSDPSFSKTDESLASPAVVFGSPGQIAITSEFDIDLRYVSESLSGLSESGPDITISPSIMFFIANQLAVGGLLGFHHEGREDDTYSSFIFGPIASYNFPISDRASIFPTFGLTYTWEKTSVASGGGRMTNSGAQFGMLIKAPVLFHPFPHVFVGFGPVIIVDFTSSAEVGPPTKTRSFGLTMDLGFWL